MALLTDDYPRTARALARVAGCDVVEIAPTLEGKVTRVRDLIRRYGPLALVGDGVTDRPALGAATVGVAVNTAYPVISWDMIDVAVPADTPQAVAEALRLARRNRSVVW